MRQVIVVTGKLFTEYWYRAVEKKEITLLQLGIDYWKRKGLVSFNDSIFVRKGI